MTRSPARPLLFAALSTLSAGALLTTAACSGGLAVRTRTASSRTTGPAGTPTAHPSPAAAPALTEAQARAALITETDLGAPWVPTEGTAAWRDGILKASTADPDCRRLLDALYADEILGPPTATQAVTVLDDPDDGTQLRYQVGGRPRAEVDHTLAWLRELPRRCHEFTATTTRSGPQRVQVTDGALPPLGDAGQSLHITLTGATADGEPSTLTLDTVTVRLGDDALTVTDGGPGTVSQDTARQAARAGTDRLTEVRKQGRVQV
ncbi:hypothetical protein [Streptomyces sp. NPDC005423]|uniref:hypothetical protein n=1 Tax=Streptomyces sp. NPDC005423 TaxID=3155343 RepID=UPI0033B3875F